MISEKQKPVVRTHQPYVVVNSRAASGKTNTIIERLRFLLDNGADPKKVVAITFTNMAAAEILDRLGNPQGLFVGTVHSFANYCLLSSNISTEEAIQNENFDALFHMVKENPGCIPPVDHLILDEAQDSTQLQFDFVLDYIKPKNFMLVGDAIQCQPQGTKILLRGGLEKNIEDVQIGDDLVYYDSTGGRCSSLNATAYNAIHKRVEKISCRKLNNETIVKITTQSGLSSRYTNNHRTFIKIKENTEYEHVVYLMSKGDRFRVGKVPLRGTKSKNGNPWRSKMVAEGCDKIWLLKAFKTDKEARVFEQRISYVYQIPQLCWQLEKVTWTQEDLDYIYKDLNTYESAKKCLSDYNRDIRYPIIDKNIDWMFNQKFSFTASCQIYAANIMSEIMDCVVYGSNTNNHSNKHFEEIISDDRETSNEMVYSLQVEGGTYVADGIVTHNSLYSWAGAEPEVFEGLKNREGVSVYSLNENYRNGRNILNYARKFAWRAGQDDDSIAMRSFDGQVYEIEHRDEALVNAIKKKEFGDYGEWFVLCRTNAQIDQVASLFDKEEIPYDTFKQSELTRSELNEKMKDNTVKILTVHAAKGLEAPNVYVIGCAPYSAEEACVCYVAATRARDLLVWTKPQKKKKSRLKVSNWE